MEHGSRTRLVTIAVLLVVFGSGVLLGFAADGSIRAGTPEPTEVEEQGAEEAPEERSGPIYAQVHPTPEQQEHIDSVVDVWRDEVRELNSAYRPRFDELEDAYDERRDVLRTELREGIIGFLTAEQAEEYRRLLADYDRRRAQRREERDR